MFAWCIHHHGNAQSSIRLSSHGVFFLSRNFSRGVQHFPNGAMIEEEPDLLAALLQSDDSSAIVRAEACPSVTSLPSATEEPRDRVVNLPTMKGKVGSGRHGEGNEKSLLALHMRHCKSLLRQDSFRSEVADLLDNSVFHKNGKLIGVRAVSTTSGILLKLKAQSKGNRYVKKISWGQVLEAAYGKFKHTSHIALAGDISRSSAMFASVFVGSVYMGQQANLLGKLHVLMQRNPGAFLIRHLKWDETTLWTSLNPDKGSARVQSSWEIMVARQRIVVGWADGSCAIVRIVMPPVALLAGGAHHMYYAMKYHPSYRAVQDLLELLGAKASHRINIYESDGAYANERLIAHLIQKHKAEQTQAGRSKHVLHVKCQNHQSQLINVALLAAVGNNVLSRMYGMAVYIRNLGNWLRLKQALYSWVDQNLCFSATVIDPNDVKHDPTIMEMVDYLRANHYTESKSDGSISNFEKAVANFLEMFNGDIDLSHPCHHCTHFSLPLEQRHCADRQTAVRKCVDVLIQLFLTSMPSIPSPNKWTTLYPSLDTCFLFLGKMTFYFFDVICLLTAFKGSSSPTQANLFSNIYYSVCQGLLSMWLPGTLVACSSFPGCLCEHAVYRISRSVFRSKAYRDSCISCCEWEAIEELTRVSGKPGLSMVIEDPYSVNGTHTGTDLYLVVIHGEEFSER